MRFIITRKVKTYSDRESYHLRPFIAGILVVILASLLLFGASACSTGGDSSGGPRIQFQYELIDLGTASPGDKLHAEFHFRNAGNETLEIGEITTEVATEGCWPPKPVVRDTTLEPGEENSIDIDYNVKEVEGPQVFKYLVKSNDRATPEKVVVLQLICVLD